MNSNNNSCQLLLLGVAQDAGVPQTGCKCRNCTAVWSGDMARQFAVSAAIIDAESSTYWLIDCTPEFKDQYHLLQQHLESLGLVHMQLGGVLLTHLHMGHYLGLIQFGREAMDWKGVKVWGTTSVCSFLSNNQPWSTCIKHGNFLLQHLEPGEAVQLSAAVTVTAVEVPHRAEFSDAVGFYIQGPDTKAFYLPDIDSWDQWRNAGTDIRDVVKSADISFLDGCFYSAAELPGRDMQEVPHPLITDTIDKLDGLDLKRHTVVMIHLNHGNPVWRNEQERHSCLEAGLHLGSQGTVYSL